MQRLKLVVNCFPCPLPRPFSVWHVLAWELRTETLEKGPGAQKTWTAAQTSQIRILLSPCLSVVVGLNEILDRYVKRMWTLWNFFFRCVFAEGLNVCRLVAVRCVNIVWEILAHYPLQEWMFSVNTEWSWELFMLKRRCRPGKQNASKGWV